MKSVTPFLFLATSAAVYADSTGGQGDLLTILQNDPSTVGFAGLLQEHPDLVANLDPTIQYTVFAPSNDAVAAFRASTGGNGTLQSRSDGISRRSISDTAAAIALLFTDRSTQADLNIDPTDLITNLTDPAFINLGTVAPSSNSVQLSTIPSPSTSSSAQSIPSAAATTSSLAPSTSSSTTLTSSIASSTLTSAQSTSSSTQSTSSFVQSTLSPPPSTVQSTSSTSTSSSSPGPPACRIPQVKGPPPRPGQKRFMPRSMSFHRRQVNSSTITLYSGFGDTSQASTCETAYSNGTIRTVDSFFTLFGDLQTTLQQTNGTTFLNSLQNAGILDSLSNTPKITVFVPEDSVLQGQNLDAAALKQYILYDTLATTTGLSSTSSFNSSAGKSINSTVLPDGSFTVNNAYITGPNVMIKNGVVHLINNVFTPTQVVASAAVVNAPILQTAAVAVAIVVSYFGATAF